MSAPPQLFTADGWSVTSIVPINPFVFREDLQVPSPLVNNFSCQPPSSLCTVGFELYDISGAGLGPKSTILGGDAFGAVVYVNRGQ